LNNDLLKAIKRDGHIIGNHTLTHPNLLKLKDDSVKYEIENGLPGPWLRAPEGRYNNRIRKIAKNLGYSMCYWSIDSCDWKGSTVKEMRHTILSELHPGAVILFHIHGHHTISLLPDLIDDIRLRGYELTSHKENWQPAVDQLEPVDMLSSQI
jgi:peptidoglycan/xylan/chitin deacetylase (PgdA/CDA1 family)